MEKVYNGACMALPEKDEDLFERINERTAHRRAERERSDEEARQFSEALSAKRKGSASGKVSERALEHVAGTVARLLLAAVFAGAVARGWCDPYFGMTGAAICGLWALNRWRR